MIYFAVIGVCVWDALPMPSLPPRPMGAQSPSIIYIRGEFVPPWIGQNAQYFTVSTFAMAAWQSCVVHTLVETAGKCQTLKVTWQSRGVHLNRNVVGLDENSRKRFGPWGVWTLKVIKSILGQEKVNFGAKQACPAIVTFGAVFPDMMLSAKARPCNQQAV